LSWSLRREFSPLRCARSGSRGPPSVRGRLLGGPNHNRPLEDERSSRGGAAKCLRAILGGPNHNKPPGTSGSSWGRPPSARGRLLGALTQQTAGDERSSWGIACSPRLSRGMTYHSDFPPPRAKSGENITRTNGLGADSRKEKPHSLLAPSSAQQSKSCG
jgi:hypothetical protein